MAVLSQWFPWLEIALCPRESNTGCPFRSSAVRLLRVPGRSGLPSISLSFLFVRPGRGGVLWRRRDCTRTNTQLHSQPSPPRLPQTGSLQSSRTPTSSSRPDPTRPDPIRPDSKRRRRTRSGGPAAARRYRTPRGRSPRRFARCSRPLRASKIASGQRSDANAAGKRGEGRGRRLPVSAP